MASRIFSVPKGISSIVEIAPMIPEGTEIVVFRECNLKSLEGVALFPKSVKELSIAFNQISSLHGIEGSSVERLYIYCNQVKSLYGLSKSNIKKLYIYNNQVESLEGLEGSQVETLQIYNNPCYDEFKGKFEGKVEKVKEYYSCFDIKDPGFE